MTPEERAVIEAAIKWRKSGTAADMRDAISAMYNAVDALIATRSKPIDDGGGEVIQEMPIG